MPTFLPAVVPLPRIFELCCAPGTPNVVALAAADSAVHPTIMQSLAVRAARGEKLGVIVGHNRLDLYAISRWARARHLDPRPLLERIELSRAFTCHQLHRRIMTLDSGRTGRWSALYVLGMLDTFYDEDVEPGEVNRLLQEALAHLRSLAAVGLPVLITVSAPKEPGREFLLDRVQRAAGLVLTPAPEVPALEGPRQLALGDGTEREGAFQI